MREPRHRVDHRKGRVQALRNPGHADRSDSFQFRGRQTHGRATGTWRRDSARRSRLSRHRAGRCVGEQTFCRQGRVGSSRVLGALVQDCRCGARCGTDCDQSDAVGEGISGSARVVFAGVLRIPACRDLRGRAARALERGSHRGGVRLTGRSVDLQRLDGGRGGGRDRADHRHECRHACNRSVV